MKQLLLAIVLILVPVGAFSAFHLYQAAATASLGDLSSFKAIVADAETIAASGDMAATERRMTDFETAWDQAQPRLRALDSASWGTIDDAHDAALKELRAVSPDPATVSSALTALMASLDNPANAAGGAGTGKGVTTIAGVTITDENGRALPCEEMLKTYRARMATTNVPVGDKAQVDGFLAKGTERCNADDDRRADQFFAQGLSLMRR